MDNSIQPINDPENFTIPESNPEEIPYVPTQTVIVNPVSVEEPNVIDKQLDINCGKSSQPDFSRTFSSKCVFYDIQNKKSRKSIF